MKVLFFGIASLAAAAAFAAQPGGQECATKAQKSGCCATEASAQVAQDCSTQQSCSSKTALASAQALPECPLAGSKCLTEAFDAAATKLASLSDEDRAALGGCMEKSSLCPIGKRVGPSMAYLTSAVAAIHEFDAAMAQCDTEAPEDMKALLKQRCDIVAAVHDVLAKQNTAMASMHCSAAKECSEAAAASCSTKASTSECTATAAAKQECSTTKATVASTQEKASECTATAAAKQECSTTKAAVASAGQECSTKAAIAASQECPSKAAVAASTQECSSKAAIAAQSEFCWDTFKTKAVALNTQGDELLSCWSKVPTELASLDDETKGKLASAFDNAARLNPAMGPSLQAVGYYAKALKMACDVDAKIVAAMNEAGCSCEYYQASSDLLKKAAAVASTVQSSMPKPEGVASAF